MAYFYKGFVYECGVSAPLTIEGCPIVVEYPPKGTRFEATLPRPPGSKNASKPIKEWSRHALAKRYIENSGARRHRDRVRRMYLEILRRKKDGWNCWRRTFPHLHPVLSGANLCKEVNRGTIENLDGYNFSYTNLTQANLHCVSLKSANFHQAILAKANLSGAHVEGANFCRTDLYETNFKGAHFAGANLQGVQLAKTDLRGADLRGCNVYGLSAWDLQLDDEKLQRDLRITYQPLGTGSETEEVAVVDGLDLAAFIYMTLNNVNISRVFDATSRKWVLLLGRFTKHKGVLERLRTELKARKYVPIIFDFSKPEHRDLIETVVLLAGMSALVIVDITDPRSTPMELQAIAPTYGVPIVPIIGGKSREFGTFPALRKFPWVLPTVAYRSIDDLAGGLDDSIIKPARAIAKLLRRVKNPPHRPSRASKTRRRKRRSATKASVRRAARAGRRPVRLQTERRARPANEGDAFAVRRPGRARIVIDARREERH